MVDVDVDVISFVGVKVTETSTITPPLSDQGVGVGFKGVCNAITGVEGDGIIVIGTFLGNDAPLATGGIEQPPSISARDNNTNPILSIGI